MNILRVSLGARPVPPADFSRALFRGGPTAVLGETPLVGGLPGPVAPTPATMFGPRGAAVAADGSLWVSDTGHHRVLGWSAVPEADATPANVVLGQPDFFREGRNARGTVRARTMNVPTGICAFGDGIAVADAWNHRVLLWRRVPVESGTPPDVVLGQADFLGGLANRGASAPGPCTMHWPYGVAADGERLFVADSGNRRVLAWTIPPTAHGQPADRVLGQLDRAVRDENAGHAPDAMSMRWPHGIAVLRGTLCVADAGNNRVMLWDGVPTRDGAPADAVIGQPDFAATEHNQTRYWPDAACLNMPYSIAAAPFGLLVADTANSRLLGWDHDALRAGGPATRLAGQPDFSAKGDNQWRTATRASLCWPYGVSVAGGRAAVADSGNNRVSIWDLAA